MLCQKLYTNKFFFGLICCILFAQSCVTAFEVPSSKFHSANNLSNIRAQVNLNDNTTHFGYLSLNSTNDVNSLATIHLPKERKQIELPIHSIAYYEVDEVMYYLKFIEPYSGQINLLGNTKPKRSFVKLITPKNFSIQMFSSNEYVKDAKSSLPNIVTHYYINCPKNNDTLLDIAHPNFKQQFEKIIVKFSSSNNHFKQKITEIEQIKKLNNLSVEQRVNLIKKIATLYQQSEG